MAVIWRVARVAVAPVAVLYSLIGSFLFLILTPVREWPRIKYWGILPVLSLYAMNFIHEYGHVFGAMWTGGTAYKVKVLRWVYLDPIMVAWSSGGTRPVVIAMGPIFGIAAGLFLAAFVRSYADTPEKWHRYKVLGFAGLIVALRDAIYGFFPMRMKSLGGSGDGYNLHVWLDQNWDLWPVAIDVGGFEVVLNPGYMLAVFFVTLVAYAGWRYFYNTPTMGGDLQ
ncbi:hypothetical protein [Haloglomus salinum]|uniref:hypothetical protein n=1 Tax=Haloglomus salinum TaxID=2962673 RepID=UPI0020C944C6|nr:hypothetical protein [Haloglomus salinum]